MGLYRVEDVMPHMLYVAISSGAALLGAALLVVWMAIEVIGYGGALFCIALRRGWIVLPSGPRVRKARDIRWGVAVRAAGLRPRTS
jgi:hypothetical protein